MKSITFFTHNIYAMGGTVKSISQLANVLAQKGHNVKIISVFKGSNEPYFELHPNIEITALTNYQLHPSNVKDIFYNRLRKFTPFNKPRVLSQHEPGLYQFSSYVENKMIRSIKSVDTDVLIGTRASFNIFITQHAPTNVEKIGMEHMNFDAHPTAYQDQIVKAYRHLDKITTLTSNDKKRYESVIDTPAYVVPNVLNEGRQSLSKRNLIIAAGRLEYEKGFDLLIDSINNIQNVMREQNYKLAIYGEGQERTHLQQQIEQFNLADIISLNPTTKSLSSKLAESKYTVIPSRNEGFGMVILEAMNQGSVVVSFDDIVGPTSIIDNEQNGYLVTQGDVMALSNKLQALFANDDNNADIVENGYKTVKAYEPNAVYTQFLTMLND